MRRLLTRCAALCAIALAGCHTCDVCDDCGDCGGMGCGYRGYHAQHYGDPGFAPGYVVPEGAVIGAKTKAATAKTQQAVKPNAARTVR